MSVSILVQRNYAFAFAVALASCGGSTQPAFLSAGSVPLADRSNGGERVGRNANIKYELVILRGLGGNFTEGNGVNDRNWIAGFASLRGNSAIHAVLWRGGRKLDLGTLGGPNSAIDLPLKGDRGQIPGFSETSQADPYVENFCNFPAAYNPKHLCRGFRWQNGVMTPLPTLGGKNGEATGVNNHRQIVGFAETGTQDPSCIAPQVFDFEGAIWRPDGTKVALPPYAGDAISGAFSINDKGQVVGTSGTCGPQSPGIAVHAVLWQDGSTIDLGNLGGSVFNVAAAINNHDQIVGFSGVAGSATFHAFLWRKGKMRDLGTLPGDVVSLANSVNDQGQIVGFSIDASGNNRAFIWENGSMTDLNRLVSPNSQLHLMIANDINDQGWIVGDALDSKTGNTVAYLLIPKNDAGGERGFQ
jgi:probable HAF family extracellular repeat protein